MERSKAAWLTQNLRRFAPPLNGSTLDELTLKPLSSLTADDLAEVPVWEYDGASDPTAVVRPAGVERVPVFDERVFLAATDFVLADGVTVPGYCSPADPSGLDYLQPVLLLPNGPVALWSDDTGPKPAAEVARELGRRIEDVYPIRFRCRVEVEAEENHGVIQSDGSLT